MAIRVTRSRAVRCYPQGESRCGAGPLEPSAQRVGAPGLLDL